MQADPEEYLGQELERSRFPLVELLLAAAIIAALAAYWFWGDEKKPAAPTAQLPATVVPATVAGAAPDAGYSATHGARRRADPEQAAAAPATPAATAPPAPLTIEEGDALLRRQVVAAGAGPSLGKLVSTQHPVEVSAALIDGLGRGIIQRKLIPASPPAEAFSVVDDGDTLYMNTASYRRYDTYADAIAGLDSAVLVNTFHTLRPLFEQSYENLGLDPGDFDNAVIRTLDLVLATPEIGEPIPLQAKSVVYLYADPALEGLPPLQKQLLRMGPDNLRRIKQQAQVLREGLLAQ
ncbi:MAG: DUF3014 domain-containing protein [Halioglobus sp.]